MDSQGSLTLQSFALNQTDSLYVKCEEVNDKDDCDKDPPKKNYPYWQPSPLLDLVFSLKHTDLKDTPILDSDTRFSQFPGFTDKFRANPNFYFNALTPTFDVVVTNSDSEPAILTSIDVLVFFSHASAEGDGEDSETESHELAVLHRYELTLPKRYYSVEDRPFHFSTTAIPPLVIRKGDPARFQVGINAFVDAGWIYGMQVRFHFGPHKQLTTKKFWLAF